MAATQGASKTLIQRLAPSLRSLMGVPSSTIHLTGVTFKGPVGEVGGPFGSWSSFKRVYGGLITTSYLPVTMWAIMRAPRGLKRVYVTRVTHFTDPDDKTTTTATKGVANLSGATTLPTQGASTGNTTGPWNLNAAQTLVVHCDADALGPDTATFNATAAALTGGAFGAALVGGDTITLKCDGDPDNQVFTFAGGEVAAGVAALINATARDFRCVDAGATVNFVSDTEGTNSRVEVVSDTGGAAAKIGHIAPSVATGTGNVGDIDAVTFAEAKAIIEAAVVNPATGVTVSLDGSGFLVITSDRPGGGVASKVQVTGASTAVAFGFDALVHSGTAGSTVTVFKVHSKYPGDHTLTVDVENPTSGVATEWKLRVYQNGDLVETWDDLPALASAETVVNDADVGSAWVELEHLLDFRPSNVTGSAVAGGGNGLVGLVDADFIGDAGIRSTRLLPDYIALRAVPGWATAVVQPDLVSWCEETNSFAPLAGAFGFTVSGVRTYVKTTAALKGLSEYGAFYWPNPYIANPDIDVYGSESAKVLIPAEGPVLAAIIMQDDKPGGVHEAAGGLENGTLPGVVDIETSAVYDVTNRDMLYPDRINIIHHDADGEPFYIDGSRTLKSDGPFPSIGESRGVIYITETVKRYVDPKRHQNMTLRALSAMRNTVDLFLRGETKLGAFFTDDPERAYYVDTSEAVNPASERAKHVAHVVLGLAKAEPMEWILLEVTKDTRALYEELGL